MAVAYVRRAAQTNIRRGKCKCVSVPPPASGERVSTEMDAAHLRHLLLLATQQDVIQAQEINKSRPFSTTRRAAVRCKLLPSSSLRLSSARQRKGENKRIDFIE